MQSLRPIRRALISVSDKTGVVEFAQQLSDMNIDILSTGGTAKLLAENNIPVTEVSSYTGFPEMMDGRIKTLHPKIHGALLGRRGTDDAVMNEHGIEGIDLLCVNLYPFEQTVAKDDCTLNDAIENIDIGGPTMLRAAAKNHNDVTVVVDHNDYSKVISALKQSSGTEFDLRFMLATKTFAHTAKYDGAIANYLSARLENKEQANDFLKPFRCSLIKLKICATVKILIKRQRFMWKTMPKKPALLLRNNYKAKHCPLIM